MSSYQAEQQLILISAGIAARRQDGRKRARELTREVDWTRLVENLRSRRLLTTLGPRIVELAEGQVSDNLSAAVEQALETGRRQSALLQLISLRVMAMLAEEEVPCAPLKGPLLGEAIYSDVGRRLSNDIDLLVAPANLQTAVEVVRGLGYRAPTDYVEKDGLPQLHFTLVHERRELPPIELHWRVHWYERSFALEQLLPPTPDKPPAVWRPAPNAELGALLLFYARDGFIDLRLATDLSAWWDVYGAALPPAALDELLLRYPALARVILAAVDAAERTVGLPAAEIIGSMPKLRLRERAAVRLANPNPDSSQSQLYADMGLIDGLLTPRGGFGAFIRRQVLPPRQVLAQQARHGAKQRARSRLGRGAGVLARYMLRMARLLSTPNTSR